MSRKRKFQATSVYHIPAEAVESDYVPTSAYVDEISKDGRRVRRQNHVCYAPPDSSHLLPHDSQADDDLWTFDPGIQHQDEASADNSGIVEAEFGSIHRQFSTVSSKSNVLS